LRPHRNSQTQHGEQLEKGTGHVMFSHSLSG
jgi:hypothetical protein